MISVFWGSDLKKCTEILQHPMIGAFDQLTSHPDFRNLKALAEIKSILKNFASAEVFFNHLEQAYVRLFISDKTGVTAPLYASCYETTTSGEKALLMGAPAIDMNQKACLCQMKSMNRRITYRLNWNIFIFYWKRGGPIMIKT
jgi:TorA maturation chaperone TorD